jgi:hypothetical protein
MTDHLANRQTVGLDGNRSELNAKLDALARHFDLDWLMADGANPLQRLWRSRDAIATNELLNFGDAVENFEKVDANWLRKHVSVIKAGDEGNRAGAIFELLGLNTFLSAGNRVIPAASSNPGYDGVVELPDQASLLVSIKNHGMTSYERFFQRNAEDLDQQFTDWLRMHAVSGVELRIQCSGRLDSTEWAKLKQDVKDVLNGQLDGTARKHRLRGAWAIILENIAPKIHPLSAARISSVVFISARCHKNEQSKFLEDLRKGCSNLIKHTRGQPDSACPVLFVRLCTNASFSNCTEWTLDYFKQSPTEKVGVILLYQAAVVTSETSTSIVHYIVPILGPHFETWANPSGKPIRQLPNLAFLIGVNLDAAARKVIQTGTGQISLDGTYTYQRGDIYRFYRFDGASVAAQVSNPAPRIRIHAEIGDESGSTVLEMISPATGELYLLS